MGDTAPKPHQDITVTFEPLYIVGVFVFCLLKTRVAAHWGATSHHQDEPSPVANDTDKEKKDREPGFHGVNPLFHPLHFILRVWRQFPFAAELLRFISILIIYRICAVVVYFLWGLDSSQALKNAMFIVKVQTDLGFGWLERALQDYFWPCYGCMVFFNRVYKHCHIPGTATFIAYLFVTDRALYHYWILPFSAVNIVAFVIFAVFPCTPPRLIPSLSIRDAMHTLPYGIVNEWQDHRFANQHAAVPSMHCGWSTFVFVGLALALCRRRAARMAAVAESEPQLHSLEGLERGDPTPLLERPSPHPHSQILVSEIKDDADLWRRYGPLARGNGLIWLMCALYPFTVLMSVMVTGNHFFLDAVAGVSADAVAYFLTRPRVLAALRGTRV